LSWEPQNTLSEVSYFKNDLLHGPQDLQPPIIGSKMKIVVDTSSNLSKQVGESQQIKQSSIGLISQKKNPKNNQAGEANPG